MSKDETSIPTSATESMLLTAAMEAKEERDVMTLDVHNAFLQQKKLKMKLQKKGS